MKAVVREGALRIGPQSPFLVLLIVFLPWLLIKGEIIVLEYQSILSCQREERATWGEEKHRGEYWALADQTWVHLCGVGVRTGHSYSALCYSPSALSWWDESEAVETEVPSGPATRLRLKEPVTAMGQGRRQLICMLNVWKWEQIVELGDKYWTVSGPETKPTWGNERLWKANELPEMKQGGRAGERLRTESPGTPY